MAERSCGGPSYDKGNLGGYIVQYTCTLFVCAYVHLCAAAGNEDGQIVLQVPAEFPAGNGSMRVCVAAPRLGTASKLVGFVPHASAAVVQELVLYGCPSARLLTASSAPDAWRCDDSQPLCGGKAPATVLYGWGRGAPSLELRGLAFSVGPHTALPYLVLQVRYGPAGRPPLDGSGLTLRLQSERQQQQQQQEAQQLPFYAAGALAMEATLRGLTPTDGGGAVRVRAQASCCINSHQAVTMLASRVSATAVKGARVRIRVVRQAWNGSGAELLAAGTAKDQSFVETPHTLLWPGDSLTISCKYEQTQPTAVATASSVGSGSSGGSISGELPCGMQLLLYSRTPFAAQCTAPGAAPSKATSVGRGDDLRPGGLPLLASFVAEPYPRWAPPPAKGQETQWGETTGVAVGPDDTLWVLYRGSAIWNATTFDSKMRATHRRVVPERVVVQHDPDTGTVLRTMGGGLMHMPHSVAVDVKGNVWLTDVGKQQVFKLSPNGTLLMTLGEAFVAGSDSRHFWGPLQVHVLRDGRFLVADGYRNTRVVMFNADGTYLRESSPKTPIPSVVHSLLVDECARVVYAVSRQPCQVHVLDLETLATLHVHYTQDSHPGTERLAALRFGPYGEVLGVAMRKEDKTVVMFDLHRPNVTWPLLGSGGLPYHDFAVGSAAAPLTGARDRLLAMYLSVSGLPCSPQQDGDPNCGPIRKYVLVPEHEQLADIGLLKDLPAPDAPPPKPVVVHTYDAVAELTARVEGEGGKGNGLLLLNDVVAYTGGRYDYSSALKLVLGLAIGAVAALVACTKHFRAAWVALLDWFRSAY